MYCKNCGKEIEEGARYCVYCGTEVGTKIKLQKDSQNQPVPAKRPRPVLLGALIAVGCIVVGFALYNTAGLGIRKNSIIKSIHRSQIQECMNQTETLADQWDELGMLDVSEKKDILRQLQKVEADADTFTDIKKEINDLIEQKETYELDEDSYGDYSSALDQCQEAVGSGDVSRTISCYDAAKQALEVLIGANNEYIKEQMDVYQSLDLSTAESETKANFEKLMGELEKLEAADGAKDYPEFRKLFAQVDETIYMFIDPKNALNVLVQQVDATEFPRVKLYLSIQDALTGEVPEDLDSAFFYIDKKDANAQQVKQKICEVNQLNEEEALKVDMIADVSGSMNGTPLREAKEVMSNFVNSMQFDAGDMVELTSFSTGVRLEKEFTQDAVSLIQSINNLVTDDMTSLYDALYAGVGRVASQAGARCVIGFTDGEDNYSSCSASDVISIANRYHIPVFIIGIGRTDDSSLSLIADQTGGAYYNIQEVYSMQEIYNEIYRKEKDLYLLEYEDSTGAQVTDAADIQVGYRSLEYGGECAYTYTPNMLISVEAPSFFSNGPEAVVEKYMKNFDDAMTNTDFSYIEGCILPGSPLYQEQQAYVKRGIYEQLDSYEIVGTNYSDADNCIVTTRETYYVQVKGKPLQLMTQECQYRVTKSGGDWKMTSFADLKVLSRINQ